MAQIVEMQIRDAQLIAGFLEIFADGLFVRREDSIARAFVFALPPMKSQEEEPTDHSRSCVEDLFGL
jgi:hypothetical protein